MTDGMCPSRADLALVHGHDVAVADAQEGRGGPVHGEHVLQLEVQLRGPPPARARTQGHQCVPGVFILSVHFVCFRALVAFWILFTEYGCNHFTCKDRRAPATRPKTALERSETPRTTPYPTPRKLLRTARSVSPTGEGGTGEGKLMSTCSGSPHLLHAFDVAFVWWSA